MRLGSSNPWKAGNFEGARFSREAGAGSSMLDVVISRWRGLRARL